MFPLFLKYVKLRKGTLLYLLSDSVLSVVDFKENEIKLWNSWFDAFELKLQEEDDELVLDLELVPECRLKYILTASSSFGVPTTRDSTGIKMETVTSKMRVLCFCDEFEKDIVLSRIFNTFDEFYIQRIEVR